MKRPDVEFHTGVAEPVAFACRLLRRAQRQGVRVAVTAPAPLLDVLDRALWEADEADFLAHVRWTGEPARAAVERRTPLWLLDGALPPAAPAVLVNIGADAPAELSVLERIIEVVATEPEAVRAGRARWRDYQARGCEPRHREAP